jgi:hypothetical protein
MSVTEKPYDYPPAIIWNLINDIVEMRKARSRITTRRA